MRRIAVIALLVLPVVALVVGWLIWTRPPALVVSLRALPDCRQGRVLAQQEAEVKKEDKK